MRAAKSPGSIFILGILITLVVASAQGAARTRDGLQALYDFNSADGKIVKDRSGVGEPLDLKISDSNAIRRSGGAMEVRGNTLIRSDKPASKIIEAVRKSREISIEAWIRPASIGQSGPARIVTLSKDSAERNFTLGQEGDRFDVRLRTTQTGGNGIPSLRSAGKSVAAALIHVVYTRDRNGRARIHINGKPGSEGTVSGDLSNWDGSFRLALANELTSDRPWLGTYRLVAIYSRSLSPAEVEQNFKAGPEGGAAPIPAQASARTGDGLQVLYNFSPADGAIVKDRSGTGEPLDLKISDSNAIRRSGGALEVRGKTLIRSDKPAAKVINAVQKSGEITIETWVRPAGNGQSGPARIVTLSQDPNERNFTLGQDGDRFEVRFRTTKTSGNGIPALSSAARSATTQLTHLVYTRDGNGRARVYVNGKLSGEQTVAGDASNWNKSFRLTLANELTGDRPWLGTYHLVAIYDRSLSPGEVEQNFKAGIGGEAAPAQVARKVPEQKPAATPAQKPQPAQEAKPVPATAEAARHFDARIAPLLARHCVECHGPAKKKGRLDLSHRDAAFAGGKSGKAIVPGKSKESLIWEYVESDEMPDERPALSAEEKKVLREWIDGGAVWSAKADAPLAHVVDRSAHNWLRRLTVPEYIQTVRSSVGVDIERDARRILPPDLRADGFNNTAYNLNVDLGHVEAYARLARLIVSRMDVNAFAAEYTKCRELSDSCMRELISRIGKWVLRGPLEEHEIGAFLTLSRSIAEEGGDFNDAASYIVEAMLQAPRFIYRIEEQRGSGTARRPSDHELASRLSYILWGAPPDKELMRAADAGEFSDRSRVEAQVQRMLQDPRALERSSRFLEEWLHLDRLKNLRPDAKKFPRWDEKLASDMREETLAFFKEIAWEQKRPLWDLVNAQVTYVTPHLARHYGLEWSAAATAGVRKFERGTPKSETSGGLLALYVFEEGKGDTIRDVSGADDPLALKITDTSAVKWGEGSLIVNGSTLITTPTPPKRLIDAIKKSKALSLELWITPGDRSQSGPARILTLSSGTGQRNLTLGQEGNRFDIRLRTTLTDGNGMPSLSSPGGLVETRLTHVVYTRDASGRAKLYVDGEQKAANDVGGDFSNWADGFQLALANETSKDRLWKGAFHFVAIYNRALAPDEIYSQGKGVSRYDLSSVPGRGGLLTHGSVLTVGGDQASMVARGLFVLHDLLYGEVEDPPPCVDTTPVPTKPGLTQRAIAEQRLANPSCGGCHEKFEPFAFGLERFDGLGTYREKDEHGNRLRDDGKILFPGSEEAIPYQSSAELMELMARSERLRKGITRKVTQFALGRPLVKADESILERIHETAQKNGGTYVSLIRAVVMSDLVQKTQTESNQ